MSAAPREPYRPKVASIRRFAVVLAAAVAGISLGAGCSADRDAAAGQAALDAHQLSEAERAFRSALDRDPNHPGALGGLGWTYQLAGQRDAARASFRRCVDLAPGRADCLRGLASVAMADGELAQARGLLGEAKAAAPDDLRVEASLALLSLAQGEVERAAERYAALVVLAPESADYKLGLAECRLRQGEPLEALRLVDEALAAPEARARPRAMALQLKARALVGATSGREDPADCAGSAPPLRAWLDAAVEAADAAEAVGVGLPELPAVRRLINRRRAAIDAVCPPELPAADDLLRAPEPSAPRN